MKKAHRHGTGNTASPAVLAERGHGALLRERFKEAVEFFKQAIRSEPRPEWKDALADAYRGRARDLAAKGMFKEAAIVLENTMAAGGGSAGVVRDPDLYVSCLIRDGQQQKAAGYLLNHPPQPGELEALMAALLVSVPRIPDLVSAATPEQRRWRDLAIASRAALAAWCDGEAAEEIDRRLNAISLRSGFRPVRLLLKALISAPGEDTGRMRRMLDTIPIESPFYPLRQAVAAALFLESTSAADTWNRLSPVQQTFVVETVGLTAGASQFLARLAEAERGGPGVLFNFLIKQNDLPRPEVRSACLNLLPQIPDRMSQFERGLGALSVVEHRRILALAAEYRGNWEAAGRAWSATAASELNKQYTRAREIGYTLMADDIIEISDTPVLTERGDATDRSRLRVESRKWLLSKALPKVYGDKQTIDGKFTVDWAQVAHEAAEKYNKKHGGQDS
jgi:hypothetical protein